MQTQNNPRISFGGVSELPLHCNPVNQETVTTPDGSIWTCASTDLWVSYAQPQPEQHTYQFQSQSAPVICSSNVLLFILLALTIINTVLFYKIWRAILALIPRHVTGFKITQVSLQGVDMGAILGIKPGATGVFTQSPLPPGAKLPAGIIPQWSVDDTTLTVTPLADGSGASVSVPSGSTSTGFNLTVSASDNGTGTSVKSTVAVPISQPVTGFDITQTS